jgi:ABC-type nitrate/sulfonate/bicarbonate transport system substrate-binding protein
MSLRQFSALLGTLAAAALIGAGCGGNSDDGGESAESTGKQGGKVIRFAFAPDPVWDYMKDEGIIEEMGTEAGFNVTQLETWDEFGLFAGGHADIISTGTYETPLFEERGIDTVTIGKYNMNKDLLVARADEGWKTAADLPEGCKVASESTTGNTIVWGSLIKTIDGRELAEDSDDLSLITADYQIMPTLVEKGEVCAAISDPTQITKGLRTGQVAPLYDGKSASQLFAEEFSPGHDGVDSNMFVARKDFFDENPKAVAFFLKVWQRGMDLWQEDPNTIIEAQPEGFAIQNDADEKFMKDYIANSFDFFNESVYLDREWIETECKVVDMIREAGVTEEDCPAHAVINAETGKVDEIVGGEEG